MTRAMYIGSILGLAVFVTFCWKVASHNVDAELSQKALSVAIHDIDNTLDGIWTPVVMEECSNWMAKAKEFRRYSFEERVEYYERKCAMRVPLAVLEQATKLGANGFTCGQMMMALEASGLSATHYGVQVEAVCCHPVLSDGARGLVLRGCSQLAR